MPEAEGLLPYLSDPIVWLAGAFPVALLALGLWRLSGARARRLRRKRGALRAQAKRAASPRERAELMLQWSELGGSREMQRAARERGVLEAGQKARAAGRPLSANPYGHGLWGDGRRWKRGWHSVERHIRWIEKKRG